MTRDQLHLRYAIALPMMVALASCAAPRPGGPVATVPAPPVVTPAPAPVVAAPASGAWEDRALTPGDWHHVPRMAIYGEHATLRCEMPGRSMALSVRGLQPTGPLMLRTSAASDRMEQMNGTVRMDVNDVRLDRMAFSRGRFAVEDAAGRALTFPSWAEIGRVIEDCRG